MSSTQDGSSSVATTTPVVSDDALAEIQSFDDALALINETFGGAVVEADKTLGTGFAVLDDKNKLIDVPFVAVKIDEHTSEISAEGKFVSLHVVTQDGRKLIVNDGSTGIYAQVQALWERKPELRGLPLMVRHGLRRSDYTYTDTDGKQKPATTYYLDTSA